MIGILDSELRVSRFWFQEAGMIIPCNKGIAPDTQLASMRLEAGTP
jgi:hypothetical protein